MNFTESIKNFISLVSFFSELSDIISLGEAMTDTPTPTSTPTETPTQLDFYIEMTTKGGEAARIERTVTAGDWMITVVLVIILASIWAQYVMDRIRGE